MCYDEPDVVDMMDDDEDDGQWNGGGGDDAPSGPLSNPELTPIED